eukprot:XP_001692958.1 low-CO2-inducible protein [Chlamydomonas reinhardtii]
MQRIRLEIAEEVLPAGVAKEGVHRTWFWPSPAATCVAAFAQEVFTRFQLRCPGGAAGLQLLLSGFVLPRDAPIGILRDGDLLVVQRLAAGAGALANGTIKAARAVVPQLAPEAGVPGPSGGAAAGVGPGAGAAAAGVGVSAVSGKKRKSAAAGAAEGGAAGPVGAATPQPAVQRGATVENGVAQQAAGAVAAVGASPDAPMTDAVATGEADKGKGASRSARRKAAKRRLKRTGVLPYGDSAARAGAKAAPGSLQPGGGAAGAPPVKRQRQEAQPLQQQQQQAAKGKVAAQPPAANATAGLLAAAMAASPMDPNGVLQHPHQHLHQHQQLQVSSWRMGKVTAWDDAEAAVTLQPHPDARVHPLKAELDALRARLAAEAAEELEEERGSGKAPSGQDMALDWGSLPFPTEYQEDGTLAMPLAGFADGPPPGAVVAAVGGWADLAEQLRRRRQELASPGGDDPSPGVSPAGRADAGGPPPLPEVSVPAFTPKGRLPPQRQGAAAVGPPGGSAGPSSASPAQAAGDGSRPSGVQTRGAVRPRGGVRRIALGPMLNHLRESGEL